MGALWHPNAVRRVHQDAGAWQGGGRKLVWHTTEGSSLPNYGGSAPHFTLDPKDGSLWQHIPLNRAARALEAGGPNFWHTVQVELIGWADTDLAESHGKRERAVVNWTDAYYKRIAELARWIEANFDVPRTCGVTFVGNGHTAHLASLDALKRYSGHIGHQHINGNSHWDPGTFKIAKVLGGGRGTVATGPAIRDLGRGDRGRDVRALQRLLVKRGYKLQGSRLDGVFGRGTQAFVVHFQWKHGLGIDGIVGQNTRTALGFDAADLQLGLGTPEAGHVDMGAVAPAGPRITVGTKLIAPARVAEHKLAAYLLSRPHGVYSDRQIRTISRRYDRIARSVGLDPLLVVAQMVLETGNLTSFWSQPPQRNPAGIGVTGAPGVGISFPNWTVAVQAHVGRLLAYALKAGTENAAQAELVRFALDVRPLPPSRRGVAPTLAGLAGTWATDTNYAKKIARIANEIRTT